MEVSSPGNLMLYSKYSSMQLFSFKKKTYEKKKLGKISFKVTISYHIKSKEHLLDVIINTFRNLQQNANCCDIFITAT